MTKTTEDLERYLAEAQGMNAILRDAYERQVGLTHAACASERETWAELHEAKAEVARLLNDNAQGFEALMKLREDRDTLRNKLQAFEFANKSAGEFLQAAQEKIRAQRQSIGKLKNERDNAQHALRVKTTKLDKALKELSELRDSIASTSAQSSEENAAGDELKRFPDHAASITVPRCTRCHGRGFEINGEGKATAPCYKCGGSQATCDHAWVAGATNDWVICSKCGERA